MIILPSSSEFSTIPAEVSPQAPSTLASVPEMGRPDARPECVCAECEPLPGLDSEFPLPDAESDLPEGADVRTDVPVFAPIFGENPTFGMVPSFGNPLAQTDVPPLVITNSFDDEEDDDDMDEVPDEEDEDVYEEVETFDDFDDDFDEDFEDEFDEDYEDLAKIDEEEVDAEEEDATGTPARYEEEFGDVDGQTKFIPDGAEITLNEEVLISEDELEESDTSEFDDFEEDEENEQFDEFDN